MNRSAIGSAQLARPKVGISVSAHPSGEQQPTFRHSFSQFFPAPVVSGDCLPSFSTGPARADTAPIQGYPPRVLLACIVLLDGVGEYGQRQCFITFHDILQGVCHCLCDTRCRRSRIDNVPKKAWRCECH